MINIINKELKRFFNSLEGYLIIIIFLLINGLSLWVFPYPSPNIFDSGYASLDLFFKFNLNVFLFIIPAITMSMIAEEKRMNTLELLITKPIDNYSIIFGKLISTMILTMVMILPTIFYCFSIIDLSNGKIDTSAIVCGYLGLLLITFVYASIGIFCSSLSKRQLIAFIMSFLMILSMTYFIDFFVEILSDIENDLSEDNYTKSFPILDFFQNLLIKISITENYKPFSVGLFDFKNAIYLFSIGIMFLIISSVNIQKKR